MKRPNESTGEQFRRIFEAELTWESRAQRGLHVLEEELTRMEPDLDPESYHVLEHYLLEGNIKLLLEKLVDDARRKAIKKFLQQSRVQSALFYPELGKWRDDKWLEEYVQVRHDLFDWLEESDLDLQNPYPDRDLAEVLAVRQRVRSALLRKRPESM